MALIRSAAVQALAGFFTEPRYLEVGVNAGETFHAVNCSHKVAVDPKFLFNVAEAKEQNINAEYHQITSDEYFGSVANTDTRFDVIYLDGLHTAEQTVRDLLNATRYLSEGGIILIDDVKPTTYLSSLPSRQNFFKVRSFLGSNDRSWMGDVYRLIYFVDTFMQQFEYRTISDNHGQAVVWNSRRKTVTERTISEVGNKTFENFALEQDVLRLSSFEDILKDIQATRV